MLANACLVSGSESPEITFHFSHDIDAGFFGQKIALSTPLLRRMSKHFHECYTDTDSAGIDVALVNRYPLALVKGFVNGTDLLWKVSQTMMFVLVEIAGFAWTFKMDSAFKWVQARILSDTVDRRFLPNIAFMCDAWAHLQVDNPLRTVLLEATYTAVADLSIKWDQYINHIVKKDDVLEKQSWLRQLHHVIRERLVPNDSKILDRYFLEWTAKPDDVTMVQAMKKYQSLLMGMKKRTQEDLQQGYGELAVKQPSTTTTPSKEISNPGATAKSKSSVIECELSSDRTLSAEIVKEISGGSETREKNEGIAISSGTETALSKKRAGDDVLEKSPWPYKAIKIYRRSTSASHPNQKPLVSPSAAIKNPSPGAFSKTSSVSKARGKMSRRPQKCNASQTDTQSAKEGVIYEDRKAARNSTPQLPKDGEKVFAVDVKALRGQLRAMLYTREPWLVEKNISYLRE